MHKEWDWGESYKGIDNYEGYLNISFCIGLGIGIAPRIDLEEHYYEIRIDLLLLLWQINFSHAWWKK